ncbi:MAG TPA: GNAT family N-acetyltransferase [Longimicrobium sp.]|jgi:RimJ/RimL family protein N-acetyltransferase/aminoglycoside phosphotransferase (APT) family kinase protein
MTDDALTPERACDALSAAGISVSPGEVAVERRDGRWLARLPGERLAWFAASDAGRAMLARERRVLRLLEARCRFAAPRVLAEAEDGRWDVRTMVPGACDPFCLFRRACSSGEAAARLGASVGAVLAELHTAVPAAEVAGWLPTTLEWPEPREVVREHLPRVVADPALHARADAVLARYESLDVADEDRVLVHGDLGFHNLGVGAGTFAVTGVFDWESACVADRHLDFRYLVCDLERWELLDAALAAYEPATGRDAFARADRALQRGVGHQLPGLPRRRAGRRAVVRPHAGRGPGLDAPRHIPGAGRTRDGRTDGMTVLETERLHLRHFAVEDAAFALRLLNEPSFLQNIGDRGVRTEEDAVRYLLEGPIRSYQQHGHGLNLVALKETGEPIGMCGLLRREQLDAVDLGYAFLPEFWSQGYAAESAAAVLEHGRRTLGITRFLAIVQPGNAGSIRVLERLGFTYLRSMQMSPGAAETSLYELAVE